MISKQLIVVILVACQFIAASCRHTHGGVDVAVIDRDRIGPENTLAVRGDVKLLCKEVLGYEYPVGAIIYRRNNDISAWQVATRGKHGLITSSVIIEKGRIIDWRVLSSQEVRGRQVTKRRYLKQFAGISLVESSKLSKRVDAISGATITSKAMTDAAILALRLEEVYRDADDADE